jgi:hypothetical protein
MSLNSETSVLSVCVLDEKENVVGFASFLDAPPVGTLKFKTKTAELYSLLT